MKAWQYTGTGQPLTLNDIDEPTIGPGEVAIDVQAAGLCHTDVGFIEGVLPESLLGSVPQTLGHEVSGVVTEVGDGVSSVSLGDRVVAYMHVDGAGFGRPGGYAARCVLPEELVVHIPGDVPFPEAAAAGDAGMTPYHAVHTTAGVRAGDRVAIIGLGGLGFNGLQVAIGLGASTVAVEPRESVHQRALDLGAERVVTDISELQGENFDMVLDFAGYGTTTAGAVGAVKAGGTVVLVGVGRDQTTLPTPLLVQNEIVVRGSAGGTKEDLLGFLELVAEGKISPVISTIRFDEIGNGLERVASGTVEGRLVATLAD